jgi:hypothetical protein
MSAGAGVLKGVVQDQRLGSERLAGCGRGGGVGLASSCLKSGRRHMHVKVKFGRVMHVKVKFGRVMVHYS